MKKAFTMIELIFVIVIIGVLAAIALPRLAGTRDDANAIKSVMNLSIAITDAGTSYTGKENFNGLITTIKCFRLVYSNDGNVTVTTETTDAKYCVISEGVAIKNNLLGIHSFGGKKVAF